MERLLGMIEVQAMSLEQQVSCPPPSHICAVLSFAECDAKLLLCCARLLCDAYLRKLTNMICKVTFLYTLD